MAKTNESVTRFEVHDAEILAQARAVLDTCHSLEDIQVAVLAAVARNEEWRLGMREAETEQIADFIARVVLEQESPARVAQDVAAFRQNYQTLYYCFDHGLPPAINA